jgi:hypothetical protein
MATTRPRRTTAGTEESAVNPYRLGSVVTQVISWLTTFWFCEWVAQPPDDRAWWFVVLSSVLIEYILVQLKRLLHDRKKSHTGLGVTGILIDTILNTGGLFDKAGRVLTFPPIAAVLLFARINIYNSTINQVGAFVVALIAGFILSLAPIQLWNAGKPK